MMLALPVGGATSKSASDIVCLLLLNDLPGYRHDGEGEELGVLAVPKLLITILF